MCCRSLGVHLVLVAHGRYCWLSRLVTNPHAALWKETLSVVLGRILENEGLLVHSPEPCAIDHKGVNDVGSRTS